MRIKWGYQFCSIKVSSCKNQFIVFSVMYFSKCVWLILELEFPLPMCVCFLRLLLPWDFTFLFLANTVSFLQTRVSIHNILTITTQLTSCWGAWGVRASWHRGHKHYTPGPRHCPSSTGWCWPCRSCCTWCRAQSAACGSGAVTWRQVRTLKTLWLSLYQLGCVEVRQRRAVERDGVGLGLRLWPGPGVGEGLSRGRRTVTWVHLAQAWRWIKCLVFDRVGGHVNI